MTLRAEGTAGREEVSCSVGTVSAEGDLDFRGTLAVSRDASVGFTAVRLRFDLDTQAAPEQLATLIRLTERSCVGYQTRARPPRVSVE